METSLARVIESASFENSRFRDFTVFYFRNKITGRHAVFAVYNSEIIFPILWIKFLFQYSCGVCGFTL